MAISYGMLFSLVPSNKHQYESGKRLEPSEPQFRQFRDNSQRLSFAETLRATEFHFLTMLQACSQGVDLKADRDFGEGVCPGKKQTCSVGGRPTGVKARSPLAWVASAEDNEADEADRQSHLKDGEQVTGP
jgi:hypothetical protein